MARSICFTHIGKRINYEDNFLVNNNVLPIQIQKDMVDQKVRQFSSKLGKGLQCIAVSDGMGGHNAGECASRICVEHLQKKIDRIRATQSLEEAIAIVQQEIDVINTKVFEAGISDTTLEGMGATLIVLLIANGASAVLNIGDSRAYYMCNNTLTQISVDHTEGQRLLKLGILSPKEIEEFPARKNLNRYIGYKPEGYKLKADEFIFKAEKGVVMLCSDGVTDGITNSQLRDILYSFKDIKEAGMFIINQASSRNNADNCTLVLIDMEG